MTTTMTSVTLSKTLVMLTTITLSADVSPSINCFDPNASRNTVTPPGNPSSQRPPSQYQHHPNCFPTVLTPTPPLAISVPMSMPAVFHISTIYSHSTLHHFQPNVNASAGHLLAIHTILVISASTSLALAIYQSTDHDARPLNASTTVRVPQASPGSCFSMYTSKLFFLESHV